jgi:hypothetical protein
MAFRLEPAEVIPRQLLKCPFICLVGYCCAEYSNDRTRQSDQSSLSITSRGKISLISLEQVTHENRPKKKEELRTEKRGAQKHNLRGLMSCDSIFFLVLF